MAANNRCTVSPGFAQLLRYRLITGLRVRARKQSPGSRFLSRSGAFVRGGTGGIQTPTGMPRCGGPPHASRVRTPSRPRVFPGEARDEVHAATVMRPNPCGLASLEGLEPSTLSLGPGRVLRPPIRLTYPEVRAFQCFWGTFPCPCSSPNFPAAPALFDG